MTPSWSDDSIEDQIRPKDLKQAATNEGTPEFGLASRGSKKPKLFPTGRLALSDNRQVDSLQRVTRDKFPPTHPTRSSIDTSYPAPGEHILSIVKANDRVKNYFEQHRKPQKTPLPIDSQKAGLLHDLHASKSSRHSTGSSSMMGTLHSSNSAKRSLSETFQSSSRKRKHLDPQSRGNNLKTRNDDPKALWNDFISGINPPKVHPPRIIMESALRIYLDNYTLTNDDNNWQFILDADELALELNIHLDKNVSTGSTRRLNVRQSPSQYKQLLKGFKFETFQSLT